MRPRLTQDRARAIVREYPDADLSAFDVDGNPDVNALAAEEAAESIGKLHARAAAREYLAGNRPGDPATEEVPTQRADSASRRAEGSGGAQTPRERALVAINDGCLLGYDPPSAEEVVAALEAAGLRVVDAQEHERDARLLRESIDALAAGPTISTAPARSRAAPGTRCSRCGHAHAGDELVGICVGCPCPVVGGEGP